MAKKSRIIVGLPEGGYLGLCVAPNAVFFATEATAKKHGRKPPFQTELPPGMASEVYDSPDKIPADFCSDTGTATTSGATDSTMTMLSADAATGASATAKTPSSGGGTMQPMDVTCYWVNGMIVCDP